MTHNHDATLSHRLCTAAAIAARTRSWPGGSAAGRACSPRTCCKTALKQSFVMLRPDIQWKNPVMFVVEVGTVLIDPLHDRQGCSAIGQPGVARLSGRPGFLAVSDGAVCQLRRGPGRGARQSPGRRPAQDPAGDAGRIACAADERAAIERSRVPLALEEPVDA